jgi:hypothetical protein
MVESPISTIFEDLKIAGAAGVWAWAASGAEERAAIRARRFNIDGLR